MRLIKYFFGLLFAPFRWVKCWIKRDRLVLWKPSVVQFIGIPGSGKTMCAVAMMKRSADNPESMYYNCRRYATKDAGCKIAKQIEDSDLAKYKFKKSILLIDESSLNGFDSREWHSNFKGDQKNKLRQIKLHRHYGNSYITTSQSANDNDSKLRDGVVSQTWICHNRRWWVVCYRAIIWYRFDNGNYCLCVDEPSPIERIIDPYLSFHCFKKVYGKYYDSWATIPEIDNLPEYGKEKNNV